MLAEFPKQALRIMNLMLNLRTRWRALAKNLRSMPAAACSRDSASRVMISSSAHFISPATSALGSRPLAWHWASISRRNRAASTG